MKLGLGTVQFGLNYGISNTTGITPPDQVSAILEIARRAQIEVIDTAALYGDSEKVLGQNRLEGFKIVTKTEKLSDRASDAHSTFETADPGDRLLLHLLRSLHRLQLPQVYGLLLHHGRDAFSAHGPKILSALREAKLQGYVQKVGVSVYDGAEIDQILDALQKSRQSIDLIQLPVNLFDQRLIRSGHLKKLKDAGIEIHARSAFLQGLILMTPDSLNPYFEDLRPQMRRLHDICRSLMTTPKKLALSFVSQIPEIDSVICGVNTAEQLRELIAEFTTLEITADLSSLAVIDSKLINPAQWPVSGPVSGQSTAPTSTPSPAGGSQK